MNAINSQIKKIMQIKYNNYNQRTRLNAERKEKVPDANLAAASKG